MRTEHSGSDRGKGKITVSTSRNFLKCKCFTAILNHKTQVKKFFIIPKE